MSTIVRLAMRFGVVFIGAVFIGMLTDRFVLPASTFSDDNVLLYEMKEDPTLSQLIGDPTVKGFYGLEIDELRGDAAVLYRTGETLYRVDMDVKIKGQQLILKNGKRQKVMGRATRVLSSGRTEEVIYPVECPPDKNGWRFGSSFRRHVIRRNDEMGERLIVGDAVLEFETVRARCHGTVEDCGPAGCGAWGAASESTTTIASGSGLATPSKPVSVVALSKALLDGKMSERDMLATYKDDIDIVLPPTFGDLTVLTTSYRTTTLPYPEILDPTIDQRGFKIGILSKTYLTSDRSQLTIQVQPLIAEFRSPAPNKCGSWDSSPTRTLFDVRGHPAMYTQTPATTTAPESSSLVVCGDMVSVSVQTPVARNRIYFSALFDTVAFDQMERLVGGKK